MQSKFYSKSTVAKYEAQIRLLNIWATTQDQLQVKLRSLGINLAYPKSKK